LVRGVSQFTVGQRAGLYAPEPQDAQPPEEARPPLRLQRQMPDQGVGYSLSGPEPGFGWIFALVSVPVGYNFERTNSRTGPRGKRCHKPPSRLRPPPGPACVHETRCGPVGGTHLRTVERMIL